LITDFSHKQNDRIDLAQIDANARLAGNQAFDFIGTAAFSGARGQLRVEVFTDALLVQGDRNGDGRADMQFAVVGSIRLFASDFLL
jgi:serralysin